MNVQLVFKLSKRIEDRALNEKPPKGITAREHVITIIYEEMVNLLGKDAVKLEITEKPFKILFLGLQGSGKTTTIGKLSKYLIKKGYNPAIVCTDTWRPAAYEQLKQLTDELDISLYGDPENKDALDLAKKGLEKFKNQRIIIFDTAGRHKQESDLIEEMNQLDKVINPSESILVIDGTIGQIAGEQAKAFSQATDIGSIIISKLDGSGKGGGALSAVAETGAPIKFIGTGEKIDDFEVFDPERFISRLLGMGDIQTLIEKAEEKCVGATVVSLPLIPDLVNELVNKKIDAILLDGSVAISYAKSNQDLAVATGLEGVFEIANPIAVAVAKGDPKGLLPGINEAIAKMTEENKLDEFVAIVDQIQGIEEVSADAPEGYEADE